MKTDDKRRPSRGKQEGSDAHGGTLAAAPDAFCAPADLRPHPEAGRLPVLERNEYRAFVADIAERGVIHPLDITADGTVLDGHQRLRAAEELGLKHVPIRVVAPEDELAYMFKAAIRRRNLTPAQKAALALELCDYEELREQALERRQANRPGGPEVATLQLRGRTCEHVAELAGVSPRTAQDVITVRDEDPELFEQVKAGKRSAHREAGEIRRERKLKKLGQAPALPEGPFRVIYADPPWRSDNPDAPDAPEQHYPTLPLADIKALQVPADDPSILFLWAVNCQLPQALEVMAAWEFEYKGNVVWVKPAPGRGCRIRNQHELLLLGIRGKFPCPKGSNVPASVVEAARGGHSEKPECFYELIERCYPGLSKVELYARGRARPGWTAWGNEVES